MTARLIIESGLQNAVTTFQRYVEVFPLAVALGRVMARVSLVR